MKMKLLAVFISVELLHSSSAYAQCVKYVTWDSACINATTQNSSSNLNSPSANSDFSYQNSALFVNKNGQSQVVPYNLFVYYNGSTQLITNIVTYTAGALYNAANSNFNQYLQGFYVHNWDQYDGFFLVGIANAQNSAIADFNTTSFSVSGDGHLLHNGNAVPNDKFFTFDPVTLMAGYIVTPNGNSIKVETATAPWEPAGYITAAPINSGGSVYFGNTFTNCTVTANWTYLCP